MLVSKQLISCYLLLALSCSSASDVNKQEAYVIGLLPAPVFGNENITWPVTQPITGNLQTIRIGITNYGETSDDVGFHAYLPDYAEMTSFSMHSDGVVYTGKKTSQQEAHKVLKQAKDNDNNAVMFVPKSMIDHYDDEIQTAANTVHIKAKKQMTFEVQYKETMQDMMEGGVKILNRARVALDLYGTTVEDMVGELYSPNYPEPYPNNADITWWVRAPEGHAVRLNLVDLNIEECCDRLTVYDGISIHGKVLAALTGTMDDISTTILESTGNSLFLHLTSDCSESSSGFKATTSVVASEAISTETPLKTTTTVPPTTTTTGIISVCSGDHLEVECCTKTSGDGLYTLASGEQVYCVDGWTVFQRRMNGSISDFHEKTWEEYAEGFGNSIGEFWLGLRKINQNTEQGGCRLRVDLQSFDGDTAYAEYSRFSVSNESDLFRISVGGYSGTAGDSLTPSDSTNINGMAFSTNERDNDKAPKDNCATLWYSGGWWNNRCIRASPNGSYGETKSDSDDLGTYWFTWKGPDPMKFIQLKVRCD